MTVVTTPFAPSLRSVPRVRFAESAVYARPRAQILTLARAYPADRILAVFRRNAGLDERGATPPGTWEGWGHPNEQPWNASEYPGREAAQTANLLRGHYAGHFLSMLAFAAADTQEDELIEKANEIVAGLGEVQAALAATGSFSHPGFLAAYGEWQFSRLEEYAPYGEIWAPYYTTHKIMAGLIDAHEQLGNQQALDIATRMGHWVHARLAPLTHEHRQKMWSLYIAGEFGGMNETMARLAHLADEPLFIKTAALFDQENVLAAGLAHDDILTDMHANQHIPQLLGYLRQYEITGEANYLDTVIELWSQIVPGRTYAHGGTGESEVWGPPHAVAGDMGQRNAETCAAYNLIKIAHRLFLHTQDARLLDYVERTRLNHIVGSKRNVDSTVSPEVTYMFPVHPGALREYDNVGTCCGGTGLENHVTYGDGFAFETATDLWIAQYAPARFEWAAAGLEVDIATQYPLDGRVRVTFTSERTRTSPAPDDIERTVHVRIPAWAATTISVSVNGEIVMSADSGDFAIITRAWAPGDALDFEVPLTLRAEPTVDDANVQALFFGPNLLFARDDATTWRTLPLWGARTLAGDVRLDGSAPAHIAAGIAGNGYAVIGDTTYEVAWSGADTKYHMYQRALDRSIAFAGRDSGVANRRRADGSTFLSALWSAAPFADEDAFFDQVRDVSRAVYHEGLLGDDEWERVLEVASASLGYDATIVRTDGTVAWERADGLTWHLPPAGARGSAPVVTITASIEPSPTGWYREAPTITFDTLPAGLAVEVQTDGVWQPAHQRLVLGEGEHIVRARAQAVDGTMGYAEREFTVDTQAPSSRAKVVPLGSSVEITLYADDDVSGVERIQWEGEGTFWGTFQEAFVRALTDTEQVIEYAATDRAGNEEPRRRLVLPARGTH